MGRHCEWLVVGWSFGHWSVNNFWLGEIGDSWNIQCKNIQFRAGLNTSILYKKLVATTERA